MGKTIEEVNRKLIHELSLMFTKELHDDATIPYHTCKDALTWLFSQPLASRLTAEEKEMVRKEYANTYPNDIDCGVENILIQGVLERIFGAEMFNEKEK